MFVLFASNVRYVRVTELPPIGKQLLPRLYDMFSHSGYDMFSWYKYLIVNLVFPTFGFGVGISF